LVFDHCIVDDFKVEPEAAIFGFHAGAVPPSYAEVVFSAWAAPIIGREVPMDDVVGLGIAGPRLGDVRMDSGLDGDFGLCHVG
jgi:hypothetical protein